MTFEIFVIIYDFIVFTIMLIMLLSIPLDFTVFTIMLIMLLSIPLLQQKSHKPKENKEKNTALSENTYVKHGFKKLTKEQIDEIHERGKITPEEVYEEWEALDLCAPGDAMGSAVWRCEKYKNCHDCLVEYANEHDEWTSFRDVLKLVRQTNKIYLDSQINGNKKI